MKLFILLSLVSTSVWANPFSASIVHLKGKAQISSAGGEFHPLEKEDWIGIDDTVRTGKKSLLILRLPDTSLIRVQEKSELKIASLVERVEGHSFGETNLILKAGKVLINVINKKKEPVLKIKTPNVALAVRGTRFFVGHDEHSWASVEEGEVHLVHEKNEDHEEALESGQGMVIHHDKFTHPKNYNWVRDINYDASEKHQSDSTSWHKEFHSKKENFKRDEARFRAKSEQWKKYEVAYREKMEKWKEVREAFKKRRQEFNGIRKKVKSKILELRPAKQEVKLRHKSLAEEIELLDEQLESNPLNAKEIKQKLKKMRKRLKRLKERKKAIGKEIKALKKEKQAMQKEFNKEKIVRNNLKKRKKELTRKKKALEKRRKRKKNK